MADNSAIEWTEATWNPVTSCDKVSPGCAHCYAETFAERWRGIPDLFMSNTGVVHPARPVQPRISTEYQSVTRSLTSAS